jgi:hypothetical protein
MSYSFDGKVVNQHPKRRGFASQHTLCEKCNKLIPAPELNMFDTGSFVFEVRHYLNTNYFIYETKCGRAVSYCSEYCRNKHNHRFNKVE